MKEIKLTQGKVALVDDADYERLKGFKWHVVHAAPRLWYAERYVSNREQGRPYGSRAGHCEYLHHAVIGKKIKTDHKDGDGLNNQRHNLRPATSRQNGANRRKRFGCSSRFKGVSWNKRSNCWLVHFGPSNRRQHIGCFVDEIEAARAYDRCALEAFGEFAKLNFPISPAEIVN